MIFAGGVPLTNKEGKVGGAIGVSGGSGEQDHAVATGVRPILIDRQGRFSHVDVERISSLFELVSLLQ
jgi:uncharacterized protein (UPF0303 family)